MTEPRPVIIKLNPAPEEYLEAETAFLRAVGACVTCWAFADRLATSRPNRQRLAVHRALAGAPQIRLIAPENLHFFQHFETRANVHDLLYLDWPASLSC